MQINATILGQSISFIFFVMFCMKYIWPPIISAITERQKKISAGIEFADQAKKDLDTAHQKGFIYIKIAKEKAKKIIEEANINKVKIIEKTKIEADIERKKIINNAYTEINIERNLMYENVRDNIVNLVMSISEKVIEKNIDVSVHKKIISKMITNL